MERASDATAISVRDLRVVRGGATILRDISLDIPTGLVYGLVGPSGSGKTTFIRAIVGLQRIAGGTITVLGRPAGSAELRQTLGYMPQDAAVYTDLTGRENLDFFAEVYRVPRARVSEVLGLVDLTDAADRPVATYSGGQRRRVSLAIALLPSPRLLLLDEPTVGLDPRLRHRLWTQFHAWAAEGTTLLISTHVMDEAERTHRLAFLSEGKVLADGAPDELLTLTGAPNLGEAVLRLTEGGEMLVAGSDGGDRPATARATPPGAQL
jgi:ABC-2 type transport system ATP-binding protein